MLTKKKILFLILPVVLILTTSVVFYTATALLGKNWGYLAGFFFYYLFWCILVPLLVTKRSFAGFFKSDFPLFRKKNWLIIMLFISTLIAPVLMFFIPKLPSIIPIIILFSVPLSVIHGHCEELFWRGMYIKEFPGSVLWSVIIPSVFFTLWHIAPQLSIRSEHPFVFIISTIPLGVTYAIVAFVTKSAKWPAIGHTISSFFAFSLPVSMCIYSIIK
ncbi:MAG: CPBP family intramembrane metalloprotease [Spirochaetales bacterium]|nr:CPBP family intramembrane metalloprotease [Spirochaetales bacterium]